MQTGSFKLLLFAFISASHPQILRKMQQQYAAARKRLPGVGCLVVGFGGQDFDASQYDFDFVDLLRFPDPFGMAKGKFSADLIAKINPDLVYMRYPIADRHLFDLTARVDNIVFEHQSKELDELLHSKSPMYASEREFGDDCIRRAKAIVGATQEIVDYELARIQENKPGFVLPNGIDVDSLPLHQGDYGEAVNMLCLADFRIWHGVDRLIRGVAAYDGPRDILVHIIGKGPELEHYAALIAELGVEKSFVFHGFLEKDRITAISNSCQVVVGALAHHRINLTELCSLKNREYCLRGFPFVFACKDPDFPPDLPFVVNVPADEEPIDIAAVVRLAERNEADPSFKEMIRQYALDNLSWDSKMAGLIDFLEGVAAVETKSATTKKPDEPKEDNAKVESLLRMAGHYESKGNAAKAAELREQAQRLKESSDKSHADEPGIESVSRPCIGFVGHCNDNKFIKPIMSSLDDRYKVILADYYNERQIDDMIKASDVLWVEWGTELAAKVASAANGQKKILRIHSFEAFTSLPQTIPWDQYDDVVFVAQYIMNLVKAQCGDIEEKTRVHLVPNGVDLEKFSPRVTPKRNKKLAFIANIRHCKNVPFLIQCFKTLHAADPEYELHIAGGFQGCETDVNEMKFYFQHIIPELKLEKSIFFHGFTRDISTWLEDKSYIVSTSIREAHPVNVIEGMAKGLKPVVHNFPAAAEYFPPKCIFNDCEGFRDIILSDDYQPTLYRRLIEDKYGLQQQMDRLTAIIDSRGQATSEGTRQA